MTRRVVNPKFLKPKTNKGPRLTARVPNSVLKYLKESGVNVSEICRYAVEAKLKQGPKVDEVNRMIQFRIGPELAKLLKNSKINVSETCRDAIQAVYLELLMERGEKGPNKTKK